MYITASKLYDYIQCPHRIWRDEYGPQDEKIKETNPFVELLWSKGIAYEKKRVSLLEEYLDLTEGSLDERFQKTIKALSDKIPLIYQGVLCYDNLLGIPDLLRLEPDGSYVPIDIKSGLAFEGANSDEDEEGKPKKHYAVQLALYVDVLKKNGFKNNDCAVVLDIEGKEVTYNLNDAMGQRDKRTWWEFYESIKNNVGILMENKATNKPAMSGICKLCPWYLSCSKWAKDNDDPTNIFYVGRSVRDVLAEDAGVNTIDSLLKIDTDGLLEQKEKDKTFLKGVGKSTLEKAVRRAQILKVSKKPLIYGELDFPEVSHELFFDIEDDPTQEFVYMHGVYERTKERERYLHFTAHEITADAEKKAWGDFWTYVKSLPKGDFSVYYYSHHEKTTYSKMQKKYPEVISAKEVEEFFDNPNVIDLYQVVLKMTDWPVGSYSLKALATYLGFHWRDETPSGALSIQWFNDYINTKDEKVINRILEYNEDDCKATMVLKDGLVALG
ncbi:MAG: TM0106 family RecB-like putative nuclease [Candidatus Paceibacterota bacterium]|jgi:predicted RecB family nuclease